MEGWMMKYYFTFKAFFVLIRLILCDNNEIVLLLLWEIRCNQRLSIFVYFLFSIFSVWTVCQKSIWRHVRINKCERQKSVSPSHRLQPRHQENIHHNSPMRRQPHLARDSININRSTMHWVDILRSFDFPFI